MENIDLAHGISPDWGERDNILFFHGKESGPHGSKYKALWQEYPSVYSPDFQGMDLEERLKYAEFITRERTGLTLVGSSMGGLVAAILYSRYPERFDGYVLMAPAFHWEEAHEIQKMPPPENVRVVHGTLDDIVPLGDVVSLCEKFNVEVIVVEDCHRLHKSMALMIECVRQIKGENAQE